MKQEVKLIFEAFVELEGETEEDIVAQAIEWARDNYGSEVADFGRFIIANEGEGK